MALALVFGGVFAVAILALLVVVLLEVRDLPDRIAEAVRRGRAPGPRSVRVMRRAMAAVEVKDEDEHPGIVPPA